MGKSKKVLITGATGQDGSYLVDLLLEKGYEVHTIVRRVAVDDHKRLSNIWHIKDQIKIHGATLESYPSLYKVIQEVKPDEIYHLAAQSFVAHSFDDQFSTMNVNINGTHYILSAMLDCCPKSKIYFAATSEMFGNSPTPQNENTPFMPRSIYGVTKLTSFQLVKHFREAYNIFGCSGILFNHEGPRRMAEFVTKKIVRAAVRIKLGLEKELRLGNLDAKRDWGYAKEYVEAMWLMLQQDEPDDFVIATGETHTVREFCDLTFKRLYLDYNDYVAVDPKFYRPAEVFELCGDYTKAKEKLGWEPKVKFSELVGLMVDAEMESYVS